MINKLKVKKVVDLRLPGAVLGGLADAVELVAQGGGVSTSRLSAPNTTTDFSSFVTKVPNDADIVFFPAQKPGDAQTFAQQLLEQGKKAKVFGGDGSNDASQFKVAGLVRLELRTGHQRHRGRQGDHRRLEEGQPRQGARLVRARRPTAPSQVALNAIKKACTAGKGQIKDRRDVLRATSRGHDHELDPRRRLPLLDEVERPAEREVLHLPDPVRRLVQARR